MARQVGFAVGVALLVAVFTGALDSQIPRAHKEVAALEARLPPSERDSVERTAFFDPQNPSNRPPPPRTSVERRAREIVDLHVRDAFAAAMRVAAFVTLLGVPFSLTMRRRPGEVEVPRAAPAAAPA